MKENERSGERKQKETTYVNKKEDVLKKKEKEKEGGLKKR
mgnify:CR=1 FL=1